MSTSEKLLAAQEEEQPGAIDLEGFSRFGDVEMTVLALIDQTSISLAELMHFEVNQVLPLSRPAGENIDVLVGDVLVGSAEILVTDDKLAVRVAELRDKPPKVPGERTALGAG